MPGKITLDVNRRTIGKARLLWNRLTPTRGARAACRTLAERCSTQNLDLPSNDELLKPFTGNLFTAGVTNLMIEKGSSARKIRSALNTLTDRGWGIPSKLGLWDVGLAWGKKS